MEKEFVFQVAEVRFSKDGFNICRTTQGASVSGKFAARIGHCYKAEGVWETHPTYGPQYKLSSAIAIRMTSADALGRFLVYQMKGKGVGESVIGLLVEGIKADGGDLETMLDRCERDALVEYVGNRNAKKVDALLAAWPKIKPAADLMSPLLGYGLSEAMAETLVALFGNRAVQQVEDRPYDLILMVDGVSFLTADKIAMKVGIVGKTDPIRLRAALATGMRDATSNGDVGVRRKALVDKTLPLVNESILENGRRKLAPGVPLVVSRELLEQVLDDMIRGVYKDESGEACGFSSNLVEFPDEKDETVVWYAPLIEAEKGIASRLSQFCAAPRHDLVARVEEFAKRMSATLAPEQHAAVEMVLSNPVSVITGGPGSGKSFVLKVVLAALDAAGYRGHLTAPTGKAAKRITESTGRKAQTQHSLIGFAPGGRVAFGLGNPLVANYLVIDEASMDDTELMAATLNAVTDDCRVIIVGDVDQLASVGPGQVLRDIIRARVVPVTRLTKVFRQGAGSGIIMAAQSINRGEVPKTSEDGQFVFVETDAPAQDMLDALQALIKSGVDPDDIQILSPTHKGDAGCTALNKAVQALLNPETPGGTNQRLRRDSGDIRVGDRVIQNKNDKDLGLVNGDIGWIDDISSDRGSVVLSLPDKDKPIPMPSAQTTNLKLAYAITVHKSQGAEAGYVLLALDASASFMLRRSLVYTGVTRGSQKVMVFASVSTLATAVHRGEPQEGSRRTSLVSKLHARFPKRVASTGTLAAAMLFEEEDVPL